MISSQMRIGVSVLVLAVLAAVYGVLYNKLQACVSSPQDAIMCKKQWSV